VRPGDIRRHLLAQHNRLRERLASAQRIAARLLRDEAVGGELQAAVDQLRRDLREHNAAEEMVLERLLSATGTVGARRAARMVEEHGAEHAMMRELLDGTELAVAARMKDIAEQLDAHFAAEERTFLSPGVLRDDDLGPGPTR
jgi:iron-sulfur cluster repair protein YtfE (RIC family)